MKLLLFDIDGTLLQTHGTGRQTVAQALTQVCGRSLSFDTVTFSGRTDPQILAEILTVNGFSAMETRQLLPKILDTYAQAALSVLPESRVTVMPGVEILLERLSARSDVQLALLTGNLEPTAYAKLKTAHLAHYFPFGAFGSDHADRYELPAIARERALCHTGHDFSGKDIVIIGDTEHDIRCGATLGVCAVGVCTGRYSRDDLVPHAPDYLLDDLSDTERFIREVITR